MTELAYRALCGAVGALAFWCAAVPAAVLSAAWLIGIAAMCAKELKSARKRRKP